ncbi:hypothetical protein [Sphingomonas faeni]|uniref:hypothetical protein n=1 Tax=Sphingomonas faeni TaxID=185950 RepID=UPI0020BF716B|nr:hypothetical protein [Sphingomonas faeni]MCK8457478.1 hypothetical protein [Sphingomonas faeni]
MMEHPHEARDPLSATRRADVAHDLDAIFANRRGTPPATGRVQTDIVKTVPARRRRWFVPTLLGLGVFALAGASAGVALFVGDVSPNQPIATTAARKTLPVQKSAAIPPSPVGTVDVGTVDVGAVDTAQATSDTAPATPPALPSSAASVGPAPPPLRKTERRVEPAVSRTRSDAGRAPPLANSCDDLQDEERAWCLRPSLLAAHRQLRATYNAARRAGVDRNALARIQGRWTNVQRRATDRPDDTLDSYRDLRLQLLDLIDEQRSAGSDW